MSKNKKPSLSCYCRVSTEEQTKGFSLAAQRAVLEDYAQRKGYSVFDYYVDEGYSGKDFNRPEIQRLIRDARARKFDAILVWKVDRLSRSNKDVLTLIDDELKPRNIRLLVSTCDIDSDTPTGYMFISLLGTFAEYERTMILERVGAGMSKRTEVGLWNGGRILGYDNVDKELVVNDEESEIVRKIFQLRAEGKGYKAIVNVLNDHGKKTKKKNIFSISAVKRILENDVYIGSLTWGKHRDWSKMRRRGRTDSAIVSRGLHKPIIDMQLWNKVQAINKAHSENAQHYSNFKGAFILTGVLRCPQCGAGTVMSKSKKRDGSGYHLYYMCQNYHSKGRAACRSNLIHKEPVEQKVLQLIKRLVNNKDLVHQVIDRLEKEKLVDTSELSRYLAIQKSELHKQEEQKQLANLWLDEGKLTPEAYSERIGTTNEKIRGLESVIGNIERDLDKATSEFRIDQETVIEALTHFEELFECGTSEQKRLLVRALIKQIEMEPNRKDIRRVVFWFSEDDNTFVSALPSDNVGRTVS